MGGKKLNEIIHKERIIFPKAYNWFTRNKQLLNKEKTNLEIFRTRQWSVNLIDQELKVVENVSFLGLKVDEFLDWSKQGKFNVYNFFNKLAINIKFITSQRLVKTEIRNLLLHILSYYPTQLTTFS